MTGPRSERTTLRRGTTRAEYDVDAIHDILDAGAIAHVGVSTPDGPVVLPMAYGRTDTHVYVHGAVANALLRAAIGTEVCITVTIVDGLVVARSPFHNSMNYRSVVVRGVAERVEGDEHLEALRLITDHVVPNWDTGRPPTDSEVRRTLAIRVSLAEVSGKVRIGDPGDEPEDLATDHWAGTVPLVAAWGAPSDAADLRAGVVAPTAIAALQGRPAHP